MPINKAKIKAKRYLTEDVVELILATENPFNFKAGQYISIKICDNPEKPCFRAYSIASAPQNKQEIQLCIKLVEGGRAGEWFKKLNENEDLDFLGPIGKFTFQGSTKNNLFIATGTGIAPFKSMIEDQLLKGFKDEITLVFGMRHFKDLFYIDFFKNLAKNHPNFKFYPTLSQPENSEWKGKIGRVTSVLETINLNPTNTTVYICGLNAMIEDTKKILLAKGFAEEKIHFEKFD